MNVSSFHINLRAGFRQHLQGVANLPLVAWEGKDFMPVKGTPWITETYVPVSSVVTATGFGGVIAHTVTASLTLHYPTNAGTLPIDTLTGVLMERFRPGTAINYSGTSAIVQQVEAAGLIQEPDWLNRTVIVTLTGHTVN